MKYIVFWDETRSIVVDAESKEQAEEIIKSGEFDDNEVDSNGVDLASVRAEEFKE